LGLKSYLSLEQGLAIVERLLEIVKDAVDVSGGLVSCGIEGAGSLRASPDSILEAVEQGPECLDIILELGVMSL